MKIAALIPARYGSTRLPAKLVQDLGGISVIQRTYVSTLATGVFDEVWVVTDHEQIREQVLDLGGKVFFLAPNRMSLALIESQKPWR